MFKHYTNDNFDLIDFHDCPIHSFVNAVSEDNWRSDLILFIDFINEWILGRNHHPKFMISPSTMIFHNVTNLQYELSTIFDTYQVIPGICYIDTIKRKKQTEKEQLVHFGEAYYVWEIIGSQVNSLNIKFGATGFDLMLHQEPTLSAYQELEISIDDRMKLYLD